MYWLTSKHFVSFVAHFDVSLSYTFKRDKYVSCVYKEKTLLDENMFSIIIHKTNATDIRKYMKFTKVSLSVCPFFVCLSAYSISRSHDYSLMIRPTSVT